MKKPQITEELIAKETEKLLQMEKKTEQQRLRLADLSNQLKLKKFDEMTNVLSSKGLTVSELMDRIEKGHYSPFPELKKNEEA